MTRKIGFIIFAVACFLAGTFAQASTISVNGIDGVSLEYTQNGSDKSGLPGEFILESNLLADPFGYCVEQGVDIWSGTFTVLNLHDLSGNYFNAAALIDYYYYENLSAPIVENYQKAALQLVIWDVLNDGEINDILSISETNVQDYFNQISANYDDILPANLTTLSGKGYKIAELRWDDDPDLNIQDLIIRTVPEPATMLLFGLGLLGISAMGRKRS